jgi:hypothetical protein
MCRLIKETMGRVAGGVSAETEEVNAVHLHLEEGSENP